MHPPSGLLQALLLAVALRPAACAFSLDTVVTDWWYYVHNHLADTTSPACLAAYAAPIDCDQTLLGLVSSNSPNFNPGPDDLERVCVPSCANSLEAWVQNVKKVCNQSGDAALAYENVRPYPEVPVVVVGEVFQYEYAWACSKDDSVWCYFDYPSSSEWASDDFNCSNACATQFFANAHNFQGSRYWFRIYELETRSDWWEDQFAMGWQHLLDCRDGSTGPVSSGPGFTRTITATDSSTTETTSSSTVPDASETTSSDSSTSTESSSSSSSSSSSTSSPSETSSPTTPTPTPASTTPTTNAGGRLRAPAAFRALAWV
ncbi:hypothetical protein F5X97DRAFT_285974 [Nemania serpens]|nr:hypothetical protein F5X97DRAFT_285974 [Nemania serpens]